MDAQSCTFVLVGDFNPAIISPAWLGFNDLIKRGEAETALVNVVSQQISSFKADWLQVQVTQERFSISTGEPTKFLPLRDVFMGVFQLLPQTPVTAFGANFSQFFDTQSEDDWHSIGHHLAPKDFWGQYIDKAGMLEVVVNGYIDSIEKDLVRISVRPNGKNKVRVDFNHHFETPEVEDGEYKQIHSAFSTYIEDNWQKMLDFNSKVSAGVQALIK